KEDVIAFAGIDLNNGSIIHRDSFEDLVVCTTDEWSDDLAQACSTYIANNLELPFSDLVQCVLKSNAGTQTTASLPAALHDLYKHTLDYNDGMPIILLNELAATVEAEYKAYQNELRSLSAESSTAAQVLKFYALLVSGILSPTFKIQGKNKTILQLVCEQLHANSDNIDLKVILFLVLTRIRKNTNNVLSGTELIPDSPFKDLAMNLVEALRNSDICE